MSNADWEDWDNFVMMQEDREKVKELFKEGYSVEEIVKITGFNENYVRGLKK